MLEAWLAPAFQQIADTPNLLASNKDHRSRLAHLRNPAGYHHAVAASVTSRG
jgi:hypothetical protein